MIVSFTLNTQCEHTFGRMCRLWSPQYKKDLRGASRCAAADCTRLSRDWLENHALHTKCIHLWVHEAHSFRVLLEGSRCRSAVYVYSGGRYCHHHHHRHGMIVMRHKTSEERIHSREDHNLLRVVVKCPQGAAVVGPKQVVQPSGGEVSWPPHGTDNRARRLIYICFIYY